MKEGNRFLRGIALLIYVILHLWGCGSTKEVLSDDLELLDGTQILEDAETSEVEEDVNEVEEGVHVELDNVEVVYEESLSIYVCGAVQIPGVYQLDEGSRVYEAIEAAGGITEEAMESYLNLAQVLEDGQKVYVPTFTEVEEGYNDVSSTGYGSDTEISSSGKVNINTASLELLMTLSSVGETKAQAIIDYRTENGVFATIEEIMLVDGIKEGVYNAIADDIEV